MPQSRFKKDDMPMNAKRLARIKKMEDDFNLVSEVVKSLDAVLTDYETVRSSIQRLTEYQESGRWLKDFEADERGELPKDMQRGVLSEDGLDNLLREVADLHSRMRNLIAESNR